MNRSLVIPFCLLILSGCTMDALMATPGGRQTQGGGLFGRPAVRNTQPKLALCVAETLYQPFIARNMKKRARQARIFRSVVIGKDASCDVVVRLTIGERVGMSAPFIVELFDPPSKTPFETTTTKGSTKSVARYLARVLGPGSRFYTELRSGGVKPPATQIAAAKGKTLTSEVDVPKYTDKPRPDDFAVVIGIDDYKDLPDAQYAERDADAVRAHFQAMGIPKRHIILLKGPNATGNGMRKYLEEWLPRNVKPASTVFFYYSGHGAPDPKTGKAYLVPWDGDPQFLKSTAYPLENLYASLLKLKARRVVVMLDACFSGAGGRSVLAKGVRPLVTKVDTGESKAGRLVIFGASGADEITSGIEDEGHGIFTYYFLKGLQGAAADAGGRVSADALFRYLKPKVQDEARLQNREQTPTSRNTHKVFLRR